MLSRSACVGILRNLEEICAGACLVAVIAITGYNIINRYLLQQSAADFRPPDTCCAANQNHELFSSYLRRDRTSGRRMASAWSTTPFAAFIAIR